VSQAKITNLLKNASFEEGENCPRHWEWVVVSRRPFWRFDGAVKFRGSRSVSLMQDIGTHHGEFRQTVSARGGVRYRLRGRIKGVVEGTGENSGANLNLTALHKGETVGEMRFRPFFVGRHDWELWSFDYVTPPETDALIVSFDMRNAAGAAWFDEIQLFEAPEPLWQSTPVSERQTAPLAAKEATPRGKGLVRNVAVFGDCNVSFLAKEVLAPLLGAANVRTASLGRFKAGDEDAVVILKGRRGRLSGAAARNVTFAEMDRLSRQRKVIMNPAGLAAVAETEGLEVSEFRSALQPPGARVEVEHAVMRGFARGDVVPWFRAGNDGSFRQSQLAADTGLLKKLGFEVIATSVTGSPDSDGRPVVLWREGAEGGGVAVMDLEMANRRPSLLYEQDLAVVVLSNILGLPQTGCGAYVAPTFDYEAYLAEVNALVRRCESITLEEEGRTASGKPVVSLSLGPKDAPVFFVDCGIHPYEWAPTFGALHYMRRLAEDLEEGLPWARALLEGLRLKCVPVYSPDGFERLDGAVDGVNLNRNFPVYWERHEGEDKGGAPLCADETRIVADILRREKMVAAVNWHETNAATNWVGAPGFEGRYRKYALSIPAVFGQLIDPDIFFWHAGLWTQNTDMRNLEYHRMDSFPYLRDYGKSLAPYEIHYADSLGIDGLLVEQYGNNDISIAATPQRTELTCRIIEMLMGLQVGLVSRNHSLRERRVSIPVLTEGRKGRLSVYASDGSEVARGNLRADGDVGRVETTIPPGGALVVRVSPPRQGK
jgi:hypothetical protein